MGARLEKGIFGHSRFCNTDFEDIVGLLESIRRLNELNYPRLMNSGPHTAGAKHLLENDFLQPSLLAMLPRMHIPRPVKLLFQIDDGWGQLLAKRGNVVPEWTKLVVERMLACGTGTMGVCWYCCASAHCSHTKYVCQSCKQRLWHESLRAMDC